MDPKYGHLFLLLVLNTDAIDLINLIKKKIKYQVYKKKEDKDNIFNLLKPCRSLTLRPFGCNILTFDKFIIIYLCTRSHPTMHTDSFLFDFFAFLILGLSLHNNIHGKQNALVLFSCGPAIR